MKYVYKLFITPVSWDENQGRHEDSLHVNEFDRMDGCHGESRRLLISVMQLVEILVEERSVVHPMMPIGQIIL